MQRRGARGILELQRQRFGNVPCCSYRSSTIVCRLPSSVIATDPTLQSHNWTRHYATRKIDNNDDKIEATPKDFEQHPHNIYRKDFPEGNEQDHPGLEVKMEPRPDYGEKSYVGHDKLKGKIALITGGDSGIGRAVCLAYAREGADMAITYLKEEEQDAQETQRIVEQEGRQCVLIECDLAHESDCNRVVEETINKFGRIDVLVNNAAYQGKSVKEFKELDAERVERTFRVNIIAMFSIVRAALDHMAPGSSIINTGSINAYQPSNHILDYAVTKGAIVAYTKGLSQMLLEKGIRVNCVAPGPVWTPIVVQSFKDKQITEFGQNKAKYPIGRAAQPAELAPAFVFLASPADASFVSGETLAVTGGAFTG